jgi:hypothetical protein
MGLHEGVADLVEVIIGQHGDVVGGFGGCEVRRRPR